MESSRLEEMVSVLFEQPGVPWAGAAAIHAFERPEEARREFWTPSCGASPNNRYTEMTTMIKARIAMAANLPPPGFSL